MTAPLRRSDIPEPGYYLVRLVRWGPLVGAQIVHDELGWSVMIDGQWWGPSVDPWALTAMERVHWGRPSTETDVKYRISLKRWAEVYEPDHAAANPRKPIDRNKVVPY